MFRIPIYITDDEKETLSNCGIEMPLAEYETSEMIFFRVDVVEEVKNDTKGKYCIIHVGGLTYSTPLPMEELLKLINP